MFYSLPNIHMKLEKEILSILNALLESDDQDRLTGASFARILCLDKLLRQHHRVTAQENNLDTTRWGWFPQLTQKKPAIGYLRDAVDIIKDYATARPTQLTYRADEIVSDDYLDVMCQFAAFLQGPIEMEQDFTS